MSVTKQVIPAVLIAVALGASARADAILTLGTFSSAPTPSSAPWSFALASSPAQPSVAVASYSPPVWTPPPSIPAPQAAQAAPATYDAYVNLGDRGFSNADALTSGNAQAWYNSSKVAGLFGGQPNAGQIAAFDATVLQRVQQTFQVGGVPVNLTDNPNAPAAHTLSVVSNTVNPTLTGAIGMTDIGGNGFHFIDNSAPFARSVDQLEWIVAHNVAHELMLAFGVPEVHDQTGQYIDSTVGQMAMFLNPNATFSAGAIQDLLSKNFRQVNGSGLSLGAQEISPVPEPTTLAVWTFGAFALVAARRARSRKAGLARS